MGILVLMPCVAGQCRAWSLVLPLQSRSVSDEKVLGKAQPGGVYEGQAVG